ncbi:hypothetical protein FRB96_007104 [Tulasnella sp. 330]|nr:hypothetical protein FRB96_007104 [Tulasnella sp. 330]
MSAASIQSLPAHFEVFDPLTGSSEICKANAQHLRDAAYAQSSRPQLAGTVSPIRITGEHLPPSTTHVLVCIKSAPGQLNYNRAADYDIQLWFDAAKETLKHRHNRLYILTDCVDIEVPHDVLAAVEIIYPTRKRLVSGLYIYC